MMSASFYSQPILNRFFDTCIKLYWYYISSSWNKKEGQIGPSQKKTTLKNLSLWNIGNKLPRFRRDILSYHFLFLKSLKENDMYKWMQHFKKVSQS